jgi:hypothetical protein
LSSGFFFFFTPRFGQTNRSEAKLFGPSILSVGDQGLVFHQVYKTKFDFDIEEVTS